MAPPLIEGVTMNRRMKNGVPDTLVRLVAG